MIYQTSRSAGKLLENLLQWSRTRRGTMLVNSQEINIREIIDECFNIYSDIAHSKQIILNQQVSGSFTAFVDREMITTIVRNFLSNAIKFTRKGGNILITANHVDNNIVIELKDSGTGMDKETLDTIFNLDATRSNKDADKETGTGLRQIICEDFAKKK